MRACYIKNSKEKELLILRVQFFKEEKYFIFLQPEQHLVDCCTVNVDDLTFDGIWNLERVDALEYFLILAPKANDCDLTALDVFGNINLLYFFLKSAIFSVCDALELANFFSQV